MKQETGPAVLIVAPDIAFPTRDGWKLRHYQLIRAVSSRFICDLVSLAEPEWQPTVAELDFVRKELNVRRLEVVTRPQKSKVLLAIVGLFTWRPLGLWMYRSRHLASLLERMSSKESYDSCMILGDICMAQYARHVNAKRMVWDICDDPVLSYRRRADAATGHFLKKYYGWESQIIGVYLRKVTPIFDYGLVIAEKEARSLREICSTILIEVPNTIDLVHFHPTPRIERKGNNILFTGAMHSWSNREGVRFFVDDVLPMIEHDWGKVTFHVVGDGADRIAMGRGADVALTGFVGDLTLYYNACDVFVCPLRNGTGIKNKLLEAMACGCAIVTTSVGAEGLSVSDGRELLIADTAAEFASAVQLLLADADMRKRLGANARRFMEQEFSSVRTRERLAYALTQ